MTIFFPKRNRDGGRNKGQTEPGKGLRAQIRSSNLLVVVMKWWRCYVGTKSPTLKDKKDWQQMMTNNRLASDREQITRFVLSLCLLDVTSVRGPVGVLYCMPHWVIKYPMDCRLSRPWSTLGTLENFTTKYVWQEGMGRKFWAWQNMGIWDLK